MPPGVLWALLVAGARTAPRLQPDARASELEVGGLREAADYSAGEIERDGAVGWRACPLDRGGSLGTGLANTTALAQHVLAEQKAAPTRRVGCAIYTYHGQRQYLLDSLQTWAQWCDVVYAFSDEAWTVPELGLETIVVHPDGGESYGNLWRKMQALWEHVGTVWDRDRLDFLAVGGDDTFFVMPNVYAFLAAQRPSDPLVVGRDFGSFVSGAGYLVTRPVVEMLRKCTGGEWDVMTSKEDVQLAKCCAAHGYRVPDGVSKEHSFLFQAAPLLELKEREEDRPGAEHLHFHYVWGHHWSPADTSAEQGYVVYNTVFAPAGAPAARTRLCADPPDGTMSSLGPNSRPVATGLPFSPATEVGAAKGWDPAAWRARRP